MTDYKIKCLNSDFCVDEVSLRPDCWPMEKSSHTYIRLEKSGYSTFEAEEKIKDFFSLNYPDVHVQGLKDEEAITSQLFSIHKILTNSKINSFNKKFDGRKNYLRIGRVIGFGKKPIRERNLHGNCFEITVRNLSQGKLEQIEGFFKSNRFVNFINYYDSQRFGMPGGPYNSHVIGQKIVARRWDEAVREMLKTQDAKDFEKIKNFKQLSPLDLLKSINPGKIFFFVNSFNSATWNKEVSKAVKKLNKCKLIKIDHVGTFNFPAHSDFIVPTTISSEAFQVDLKTFQITKRVNKRNCAIQTATFPIKSGSDRLHKGRYYLKIAFFLPTGCYASMLVRQLIEWVDSENDQQK